VKTGGLTVGGRSRSDWLYCDNPTGLLWKKGGGYEAADASTTADTARKTAGADRELILYISRHSVSDVRFGVTKLNKELFFSDFLAYLHLGVPITGEAYQKLPKGPAPRSMKLVLSSLEAQDALSIKHVLHHGKWQHRPIALREPKLDQFTAAELKIVDQVIAVCRPLTASAISERSHGFIGWQVVEIGDTIPYGLVLLGSRTPTEAEREYGYSLEAEGQEALAS